MNWHYLERNPIPCTDSGGLFLIMSEPADTRPELVLNPLLTYVCHSRDTSDFTSIVRVCKEFYSADEIRAAKETLWKYGDNEVLPPAKMRKGGSAVDKSLEDIVSAMKLLDEAKRLPMFVVSANDLGRIPSAAPSETCSISICERLRVLEQQLSSFKDLEHRVKANENKLQKIPTSYSAAVASPPAPNHVQKPLVVSLPPPTHGQKQRPANSQTGATRNDQLTNKIGTTSLTQDKYGSHMSLNSVTSGVSQGFEYPNSYRSKLNRNRRKAVTGTANSTSSKLKGAPEPSRDVFIYRVQKGTEEKDVVDYLESNNITVRGLSKTSAVEAKFESFKLETTVSNLHQVLNANFWPSGICVRKYFTRRNKDNTTEEQWRES